MKSAKRVKSRGVNYWFLTGTPTVLHRIKGPAIVYADGAEEWYQHGKLHRIDGPAVKWASGRLEWRRHGALHRTDGPAIIYSNGETDWYVNNELIEDPKFLEFLIGKKANT